MLLCFVCFFYPPPRNNILTPAGVATPEPLRGPPTAVLRPATGRARGHPPSHERRPCSTSRPRRPRTPQLYSLHRPGRIPPEGAARTRMRDLITRCASLPTLCLMKLCVFTATSHHKAVANTSSALSSLNNKKYSKEDCWIHCGIGPDVVAFTTSKKIGQKG